VLYQLVRPLATFTFKLHFRNIYISGRENIPTTGPVILAANHPSAFIEPCVMACLQHRELNFITRGDVFKKPLFNKLLRALNLIPIFRFKDGFSNLKQNKDTFTHVHNSLNEGKAIFILCEGKTKQEKKLRPIQKGTARMVFGTWEEFGTEDIQIVPIGLTYDNADQAFTDLMISCGKPIFVKDYISNYQTDPINTLQSLTDELKNRLENEIVLIESNEDEETVDLICHTADTNLSIFPSIRTSNKRLQAFKTWAEKYNKLSHKQKSACDEFTSKKHNILYSYNRASPEVLKSSFNNLSRLIVVILLFALGLPGMLLYSIPLIISRQIALMKVKQVEFIIPVRIALTIFTSLFWTITLLWIALSQYGYLGLLLLIASITSLYFGIKSFAFLNLSLSQIKWILSSKKKRLRYSETILLLQNLLN